MSKIKKIALTGGIASGKSTCAKFFGDLGAQVHEADDIARDILSPGNNAYNKCINYFGDQIITCGSINRKKLRKIVFSDPKSRSWLNNLLHPLVYKELELRLKKPTKLYHLAVIPLLFETKYNYEFDMVVASISDYQLERALMRDDCDEQTLMCIIESQVKNKCRKLKSGFIIDTDKDLYPQLETLHKSILNL